MSILINIIKGLRNYKNYCKILTLSNSDDIMGEVTHKPDLFSI
jgi:hypothetical protein